MTGERTPGPPAGHAYDAFIVHADNDADNAFVLGYLLPQLGLPPNRVLRLQSLELGRFITDEVERGVRSSRVTIAVLSPACVDDDWAGYSQHIAAYASMANDVCGEFLPLVLGDCKLTMHAQSLVKLDFRDQSRGRWEAEIAKLRRYLDVPASAAANLVCPYRGMQPFTEEHADAFFGRDAELDRIQHWIRKGDREIYVIGPSGSGKSSLIAAGLLPRLAGNIDGLPRLHARTFRPGERPLQRLAEALEGSVAAPAVAIGALLVHYAPATSLLLVVDQLEDVFALADSEERHSFFACMGLLRADPRCVLVFTLRADFYGAFMESPLWTDRESEVSRIDLRPMRADCLRKVIENPARNRGVYVQPELIQRLLSDADRQPGVLPLLQETLVLLWSKRRHCLLALADYDALGDKDQTGLAFAVKEHADRVLDALNEQRRALALRILLRLVNFGEGRDDTRRQQRRAALCSDDEPVADFEFVLRWLIDNRLLTVTGDDRHRDVRVDLGHEILLQAWPTLVDWIAQQRDNEQQRRQLEADAQAWRERGSGEGGLLDHDKLSRAVAWRDRAAQQLGHTVHITAFLRASADAQSKATRRQRRRTWILLVFTLISLVAATTAYLRTSEAQRERRKAEKERRVAAEQRNERARLALDTAQQWLIEAHRPQQALQNLVNAREAVEVDRSASSSSVQMLFAQAAENLPFSPPLRHDDVVLSAAFSPDGARVVTACSDGKARVWDAATGILLREMVHDGRVESAAFSPDGTRIVTASADKTARIWYAASGEALSPALQHRDVVTTAAFNREGTRIVTASRDNTAQVWETITGKAISPPLEHRGVVRSAAFSLNSTRVITASEDKTARIWDAATGKPLLPPIKHQGPITAARFSPDGKRVLTASQDGTARIWSSVTGRPLSVPLEHHAAVMSATFSPDGRYVLTTSDDRTARVWDAIAGRRVSKPLVHQDQVVSAAFSTDGARVVTARWDKTVRIWDARTGDALSWPLEHRRSVDDAAFSPDGSRVVTTSQRLVWIWKVSPYQSFLSSLRHQGYVRSIVFSPDGARVITASNDKTARIWDAATGALLSPPLEHQKSVERAAFSPDGTRIVTASSDGTARVWESATGRSLLPSLRHGEAVMSAAFSPEGLRVVTASKDKTARMWSAVTGEPLSPPLQHGGWVGSAAFSADGLRVITASYDGTACVWSAVTGKLLSPPLRHKDFVWNAAFSNDGLRVLTASKDGTARVWTVVNGAPLSPPLAHGRSVTSASFSPDGTRVVTSSDDGTVRVWDAATGEPLSPPLEHQGPVWHASFSPDGARIVSAGDDGTARVWDISIGKLLSPPLRHRGPVWSASFSPDGTRIATASDDRTAGLWTFPLASGTIAEWRAIADRTSPNSVLVPHRASILPDPPR